SSAIHPNLVFGPIKLIELALRNKNLLRDERANLPEVPCRANLQIRQHQPLALNQNLFRHQMDSSFKRTAAVIAIVVAEIRSHRVLNSDEWATTLRAVAVACKSVFDVLDTDWHRWIVAEKS
ncbi:MAG: hypothetical protein AB7U20_19385, partial [Planctomycetaceae bacterium]